MIQLVSMDLDQTLLSKDKKLMGDLETFVKNCRKHSILPIIATGRGFYSAKSFLPHVNIDIVCNNGNLIRREEQGSIEYINPVSTSSIKKIMEIAREFVVHVSFHINGYDRGKDIAILYHERLPKERAYRENNPMRNMQIHGVEELKEEVLSTVFVGQRQELVELKQRLLEEFSAEFHYHLMEYTAQDCCMLEVLQSSGDKYHGVKFFAEKRNIAMENVLAIGDDVNDEILLRRAGVGIAMKNAKDDIKKVANLVSELDNDAAGALDILNKVLRFGD